MRRLKNTIFTLIACLLLPLMSISSNAAETYNAWTNLADKPNSGFGTKAFLYNGYVYCFGSGTTSGYKKIDRYQISTNTWTTLTDAPIDNTGAPAAKIGNKVYIFGLGSQASTSQRIASRTYDLATGSWANIADCPDKVSGGGAAEVDGNIYLIAGTTLKFYKYSPTSNTYTTLANPPVSSYNQSIVAYGREIYVFGANTANTTTMKYNVDNNAWTTLTASPDQVRCSSTVVYGDTAYLFYSGMSTSPFYSYSFSTGTWTKLTDGPFNAFRGSAVVSDGTLYFIGGDGTGVYKTRKYTPAPIVTVGFNTDGGTPASIASRSVAVGTAYGALPVVAKDGYRFDGWFTQASGGTLVLNTTIVTNESSHTLYARWAKNSVIVSFDSNGGSAPSPNSKEITIGGKYGILPTVTKKGHRFLGWYFEEN